jgi:hypothetical protein
MYRCCTFEPSPLKIQLNTGLKRSQDCLYQACISTMYRPSKLLWNLIDKLSSYVFLKHNNQQIDKKHNIGGALLFIHIMNLCLQQDVLHVYIGAGSHIYDRSPDLVKQPIYGVGQRLWPFWNLPFLLLSISQHKLRNFVQVWCSKRTFLV